MSLQEKRQHKIHEQLAWEQSFKTCVEWFIGSLIIYISLYIINA